MLKINKRKQGFNPRALLTLTGVGMFIGGGYMLSLILSPTIAPIIAMKPIDVKQLPEPKRTENRIIIPKIGVNIPYSEGVASLDSGAQWRFPDRGNPEKGGNFIIAAHRFSIQPTPMGTIEKSPFYHVDQLANDDKIIIDYNGKRYAYQVYKELQVKPTDTYIEDSSDEARLTLYTCTLSGASDGRVVLLSKQIGEVALASDTLTED